MNKLYEKVIGLEIHVELATKTKIFCGCSTAFGGKPNTQICPVCMAMPGTLPVLNREVLNKAIAVGLATNCEINLNSYFDRKNYFYPDNPQNYQISQLYEPICKNGYITIDVGQGEKIIRIHEIHMEEDAGKLLHQSEGRETLVDYNRAGVPLIEIVTSPDMRTAEEVNAFLQKLRLIIQYLGASDCKLNEGSMRVDVNLSVREVGKELGTRTEMKNLNSFRAIGHAIEHEEKRQIELIENGKEVELETRRWDEEKGNSYSMRSKEDSRDYRYYHDPDLPPIRVDEGMIEAIRASLPEFREDKIRRYKEDYKLPDYDIDIITSNKKFADIFEDTISYNVPPKKVSNWIMGETMRLIRERNLDENNILLDGKKLAYIINAVDDGIINSNTAKLVFEEVLINQIEPKTYIEANNIAQVFDRDTLLSVAKEVISTNEKSVTDYKSGKTKAIGFLVGQTMKKMQGKASPVEVTKILEELLQ